MEVSKDTILQNLQESIKTFEAKSNEYDNTYKVAGRTLHAMFPNGIFLETEDDFIRFSNFVMCNTKMIRYAGNLKQGGHKDSAHDLIVYSAMLEAKTNEND